MNLHDLSAHALAGRIDGLDLISLEGGIYVLEAQMDGRPHSLLDEHGRVCHLRSVEHARDLLQEVPLLPFHLVHHSPYDEMCGLAEGSREPLRVPIGMRSHW
ncbi:cation transporter [Pseudomonas sp. MAP12]|uniref:Cation transporter n=1 Tax=Geopseudomonas aromaticivorans TaxID=2849492 RepID=A0ABS6N1I2_9GAMM|nr:DUF6482 family protein [Pseudomonas aromaticivorans]MBV2134894.1 cation transporter [Pseudomonas aromaticivorans]